MAGGKATGFALSVYSPSGNRICNSIITGRGGLSDTKCVTPIPNPTVKSPIRTSHGRSRTVHSFSMYVHLGCLHQWNRDCWNLSPRRFHEARKERSESESKT